MPRADFAAQVLGRLPPFEWLRHQRLAPHRLVGLHLSIVTALYLAFALLAFANGVLWSRRAIGVAENPPFFGHLLITIVSIPLACAVVVRACRSLQDPGLPDGPQLFLSLLDKSRLKYALYYSCALIGLASLAFALVLSANYTEDIYDSATLHPWTFGFYSLIRVYQYTICYPILISVSLTIAVLLFKSLEASCLRYEPFARDDLGGLKTYMRAVDRPIYLIQLLATIIALANYLGWGGMSRVPTILAVGSVVVITLIGAVLHLSFAQTLKRLRGKEIAQIRERQERLYADFIAPAKRASETKSIVEEIEAGDRLVEIIRRRKTYAWMKYAFNLLFAIAPAVVRSFIGLYGA